MTSHATTWHGCNDTSSRKRMRRLADAARRPERIWRTERSSNSSQASTDRTNVCWETAAALGADAVRRLVAIGWGAATCLNVNFPDVPAEEAGPMTLARQGPGLIQGLRVETRTDPRGLNYHWVSFRRGPRDQGPESDVEALHAGKIVVTPLRYDRTDQTAYAMLAKALPR